MQTAGNSTTSPKLSIELVPKSCWFTNVRSNVSKSTWDRLRKETYRKAGYVCEICGGVGPRHPVECHEIWHYDDELHIQRLDGLIALCPSCHSVKHIGLAAIRGYADEAKAHLMEVNGWNSEQADTYIADVFELWRKRSEHNWTLDLSWLEQRGIHVEQSTP